MSDRFVSSIAALGIALAPALLKLADRAPVGNGAEDLPVDSEAEVQCVGAGGAPVHHRYQGSGDVDARLEPNVPVQIISSRMTWHHVAYVVDDAAALGWIRSSYLEDCGGVPTEPTTNFAAHVSSDSSGVAAESATGQSVESSPNVALGVPRDADSEDDYLMDKGAYVVSYNDSRHNPNWVSWTLSLDDLGDEDRANNFRPDPGLPPSFKKIAKPDYNNSGYDRGHMCPSAHRTATRELNSLTFLMTNMQPQLHSLNGGPWRALEDYERAQAEAGRTVFVVAGGLFDDAPATIGPEIQVPAKNFRVTVILDEGENISSINAATEAFGAIFDNSKTVKGKKWTTFRKTIREVEEASGYDFLSVLPDDVEAALETKRPQ